MPRVTHPATGGQPTRPSPANPVPKRSVSPPRKPSASASGSAR
jgi:hypothetical protein